MKSKVLFFGAAFLLILFINGWAADILGTWIAKIPGNWWMGEIVFSFKVDGTNLTGTVSGSRGKVAIRDGVIDGDKISFTVTGTAEDNDVAFVYEGTVGLNEIQFTRRLKDGTGRPQELIAKREFLRHNDYIQRPLVLPVRPLPSR
ncbi:MAG TPA: hypothetical protein VMG30_20225 [Acidobacteriota bacterium]|nr:hypothetical protein [Acidobacteriota bacterium]